MTSESTEKYTRLSVDTCLANSSGKHSFSSSSSIFFPQQAFLSKMLCLCLAAVSVDSKTQLQLSFEAIYKSAGVQH